MEESDLGFGRAEFRIELSRYTVRMLIGEDRVVAEATSYTHLFDRLFELVKTEIENSS